MDSYRGTFAEHAATGYAAVDDDFEDEIGIEQPPAPVGQDERRMQVRAYNLWASLLGNRSFPAITDLDTDQFPDFAPNSVLLDFTAGIENPGISFLGARLAAECGAEAPIRTLSDVPSRSLLSRITDHYLQILANQAPIGFEAEFVNQREATILYRGILLPFSSDGDTICHILGVINWKELADQQTTDALLLQIDQALAAAPAEPEPEPEVIGGAPPPSPAALAPRAPGRRKQPLALAQWADGPADEAPVELVAGDDCILDLTQFNAMPAGTAAWPVPAFGAPAMDEPATAPAPTLFASSLAACLAAARVLAVAASGAEDRSHQALYAAVSRAWDVALAARAEPAEFAAVLGAAGLEAQERAPFTPLLKLVFGADYDKTRLAEYAAALTQAERLELAPGGLEVHLGSVPGGLKALVAAERQLRRAASGKPAARTSPRIGLARKLRKLGPCDLAAINPQGREFTLLVARRLADGRLVLLGEAGDDLPLIERAAKQLLA